MESWTGKLREELGTTELGYALDWVKYWTGLRTGLGYILDWVTYWTGLRTAKRGRDGNMDNMPYYWNEMQRHPKTEVVG